MTGKQKFSTIQVSEYTLIRLAQLPFNMGAADFEQCVNNLLERYSDSISECRDD